MTCEQLRLYLANNPRSAGLGSSGSAVSEHVATCRDCTRFVKEQENLENCLRLVRDSATPVPESLDASVLANYRLHIAEEPRSSRVPLFGRFRPAFVLRWSAVAATVLAVAAVMYFSRHSVTSVSVPPVPRPDAVNDPRLKITAKGEQASHPVKPRAIAPRRKQVWPAQPAPSPVRVARSLPDGFRSLMYCDELSCGAAMDMIRVQLPSAVVPRPSSGFTRTSGVVNADVLVGPDGIARGIRIDEREF